MKYFSSLLVSLLVALVSAGDSIVDDPKFFLRALAKAFPCCDVPQCQSSITGGIKLQNEEDLYPELCTGKKYVSEEILSQPYANHMCRLNQNHYEALITQSSITGGWPLEIVHDGASNNKYKCKGVGRHGTPCMLIGYDCNDQDGVDESTVFLGVCDNADYCCKTDFPSGNCGCDGGDNCKCCG